jgi:hypothetical protein
LYADVQGWIASDGAGGVWADCTSTGEVERRLLDVIQSRLDEE